MQTETSVPPQSSDSPLRGFFAFLAILLVAVGQLLLFSLPENFANLVPLVLCLASLGIGLFLWAVTHRPAAWEIRLANTFRLPRAAGWVVSAVVLSVMTVAAMFLFRQFDRKNYQPVITLWMGAAGCYLAAFGIPIPTWPEIRAWLRRNAVTLLAVAGLTALAAVLRFYKLGEIPRVINGDEGWLGNVALDTVSHPYANPFALWENFGGLYLQTINVGLQILGVSPFALRLIPAIAGTLAVPAVFLFARQITGTRVALLAALLIAISHTHIQFSRTVAVGYIQDTWLIPLELYLLLSGLFTRRPWRFALAGVVMAAHFTIYLTPQIIGGILLVYSLLVIVFYRKSLPNAGRLLAVFWGGLMVMILPEFSYAITHPDEFFSRMNLSGTFQSGWLAERMAQTGQSLPEVLGGRFLHAFLSLIYYPAGDFYGSPIPVLSLFTAVLFLLGLGIALWKTRRAGLLLLNGYFWGGLVAIGVFAIPETADSYRVLMILPAALVMASLGLEEILAALGVGWVQRRTAYGVIVAAFFTSLLTFNVWVYFEDFAGKCRYGGDLQTRFASYLGNYLHGLRRETAVYLLSDDIYWYGTHASTDFLSGRRLVTNVNASPDSIALVTGDVVIATPNRQAELAEWAHGHPGGTTEYIFDCDNMILFSYTVR